MVRFLIPIFLFSCGGAQTAQSSASYIPCAEAVINALTIKLSGSSATARRCWLKKQPAHTHCSRKRTPLLDSHTTEVSINE